MIGLLVILGAVFGILGALTLIIGSAVAVVDIICERWYS